MSEKRYVASVSGGKDSTALYLWCKEQFGPEGFEAIFANTDNEHPVTVNYVHHLQEMAGGPLVVEVEADFTDRLAKKGLEPTGVSFLDLARWKRRFPSARAQFCTHELKLHPIKRWIEETDDGRPVVTLCGIRAGESARRAAMEEYGFGDFFGCDTWRPLLRWSEEQVWGMLERHGVPPNPLYAEGFSRVGCFPCIHARKAELAMLPEWAWEKLRQWEGIVGAESLRSATNPDGGEEICATFFSPDKTPYPGVSPADQVRRWARNTGKGGSQLQMFPADEKDPPQCMAGWGECE